MELPWKILNLDPASASERDVKAAYAKLIKLHRPDADPTGFQRVREAYEISLAMVRERVSIAADSGPPHVEDETNAEPEVPAEANPLPEETKETLPPALIEAEAVVQRARESGEKQPLRKAISGLYDVCRALHEGRAGIRLWQESLHRVTGGSSELVALGLTTSQLLSELEAGYSVLCHACLAHWEAARDLPAIQQLGEGILMQARRVDAEEASIVALRIGMEIGFVSPGVAMKLVHFAFPHLQREARDIYVPQVDQQIQLGGPFTGFRSDQMDFWHRRFRRPQAEVSWADPTSEAALEYVSSARGPAWEGYDLLPKIASPEWMEQLQQVMRRKHGGWIGRFRSIALGSAHTAKPRSSARRRMGRMLLILCGCLLALSQLVAVVESAMHALRRHSQSEQMARASSPLKSQWAQVLLAGRTGVLRPAGDYAAGRAKCQARLQQLEAVARVSNWRDMLVTMHQKDAKPQWRELGSDDPDETAFRTEVQKFFKSLANSDSSVEAPVLELVLLDDTLPPLLRQEALFRQTSSLPLSALLQTWKLAASGNPADARMIAIGAEWFLTTHGQDLTVGKEDRRELEILVRSGAPEGLR